MKTLLLFLAFGLSASSASAVCFNFTQGGPRQVGGYQLADVPTYVCVNNVDRFAAPGSYDSFRLGDNQGDLLISAAQSSASGRCGGYCKVFSLGYGNTNGVNADFTGVEVTITATSRTASGSVAGTLEIRDQGTSATYNIIQAN